MERLAEVTLAIGHKLRTARLGAGLTLAEVATRAGLSEGFLSRLERGEIAASIANLIQLVDVLGLGLGELFGTMAGAPARTRIAVYRGGDSALRDVAATGYRWRVLGGGAPLDRMEVFHLIFPRTSRMETMVSHPGQEHCHVLSGEVLFHVGGEQYRLKAGDGIFIDSEQPHRAENAGRGRAHVLMAVARPTESSPGTDWWRLALSRVEPETQEEQ
jgi:transcriptional regulator with XRE-family HTH domain